VGRKRLLNNLNPVASQRELKTVRLFNNFIIVANAIEAALLAKGVVAAHILSQADQQGMVFIE